jgi:acyl-[acyl-carrier-protein]-phospholipid O-acyltransferase/long-chain-fatty-acid--[acyl-carrier-protein] ligase
VLLPNVNAMPATLLGLWAVGKIPAILNYSAGPAGMATCARVAGLSQIITSRAFVQQTKLDLAPLENSGAQIVFLEDVRSRISLFQKFMAGLRVFFASWIGDFSSLSAVRCPPAPNDTAVVLFTSGSEGEPKGVELTHRNLLANIRQMLAMADLLESDRFFNALPLFHSFGLTIGLLLPLVQGIFVFLYVSPLHYRIVPTAFYDLDCTVFFGTNTFLVGYARKAHPYDFRALRYVFCGGEKLQESTATLWARKFGARVLEGYGATECAPCITVNPPMHPRHGSAGQFLPGIEFKLEPVTGISEDGGQSEALPLTGSPPRVGRLFVRGPNVMRGYVNPEANAFFRALDGWYDTGDIAKVDAEGFVFILGRLKRFAKISGEMVSLTAVEEALADAFPQFGPRFALAVVTRPDEAKGEKLVAVTNEARLNLDEIREALRARGVVNMAAPRELRCVRELPRLGSGKVNHRELEKLF